MLAGALEIQMFANIARLAQDMAQAKRSVEGTMASIEKSVSMAKTALGALGIGLSVNYFVNFVKGTIDAADHINDLSQSLGVSVRELGKYQLATSQNGTTLEALGKGIKGVSGNLAEHGAALRAAGITAKNTDGVMRQLADIFSKMPDGLEKNALAAKLFGKSGAELIPMLNQGAAGLDLAAEKSARYAAVLEQLAPKADEFNDNLAELGMASKVAGMSLVNDAIPGLTEVTKAIVIAAQEAGVLKAMLVGIGGAFALILGMTETQKVKKRLDEITDALGTLRKQLQSGTLNPPGASSSFFSFLIPDVALGEKRLGQIRDMIAALEKEQAALTPKPLEKPTFDADAWVKKYKELLKALGVEDDKARKKAAAEAERYRKLDIDGWVKYIDARTQEYEDMLRELAKLDQDALNDAQRLQDIDLKGWVAMAEAKVQANFEEAQQIAKDQIDAVEKIEAAQKKVDEARLKEWERLWSVVENTGKDAFVHLMSDGVRAFKAIGQSIKTAVIDLLYQLTARRWIIQIGAGISTSLGMGAADAATQSAAGSVLGSAASSAMGGIGISELVAGYQGASLAAGLAGPTTAGAAGMTGVGAALGAIPVWGWVALAALAIWGMSGGGAPKREDMFGMRNQTGDWWIGDNNITGHPGQAAYDAHAAFLRRIETTYGRDALNAMDLSKINISAEPGTGYAAIWAEFQRQAIELTKDLVPLTGQVKMTADAAADASAVLAIANMKRQMEIALLEAQGDATGALAERRKDERAALDVSLQALYDQIIAAQDAAAAEKQLADARQSVIEDLATIQRERADKAMEAMNDARANVWQAYDTEAARLRQLSDAMRGFAESLRGAQFALQTGPGAPGGFGVARDQFRDLARRAALGDQSALGQLGAAGQAYYQLAQTAAVTHLDVLRVYAEVHGALGAAADTADRQATVADTQISYLQQQVEHLVGIRAGVGSLDQTMAAFSAAQIAFVREATRAGGNLSGEAAGALYDIQSGANRAKLTAINDAYKAILGREGDVPGLSFYAASGKTIAQIQADLTWAKSHGALADGTDYVPQSGAYWLHPGERVTPAKYNRSDATNDELVAELRALRAEVIELRKSNDKVETHSRKTATITEAVANGQLNFSTVAGA